MRTSDLCCVTGVTTKLKRAVVAKKYQAEIEGFYQDRG